MAQDLHVKTIGKGEPCVLIHGWGWDSRIWDRIIPELQNNYELFLIDLPGCGNSPVIMPYSLEVITQQIFKKIPDNATWLGWSLGGLISLWAQLHFSHQVKKVITVASSPYFIADKGWPGISYELLDKFSQSLIQNPQQTLDDFLKLQFNNKTDSLENYSRSTTPEHLVAGLHILKNTDLRHAFQTTALNSLHIFGSLDLIVPAKITQTPIFDNKKTFVMSSCAHLPFLNKPKEFVKLVKDFMTED